MFGLWEKLSALELLQEGLCQLPPVWSVWQTGVKHMDVTWTLDLSDRCSNSATVILSLAKALTLIFRRKKYIYLCLSTPKPLLSTHGKCPALLKSESSLLWEPFRNHRASQSLHTLPPVITAEAALTLSVTSPVTDSSICHFSTIKRLSEYSLIQYSPCFRIFPLDQELAHYHLRAKSRPVACFSPQRFIGKQPHSFVHVPSVTSLCVLQLSNCDRERVTYEA